MPPKKSKKTKRARTCKEATGKQCVPKQGIVNYQTNLVFGAKNIGQMTAYEGKPVWIEFRTYRVKDDSKRALSELKTVQIPFRYIKRTACSGCTERVYLDHLYQDRAKLRKLSRWAIVRNLTAEDKALQGQRGLARRAFLGYGNEVQKFVDGVDGLGKWGELYDYNPRLNRALSREARKQLTIGGPGALRELILKQGAVVEAARLGYYVSTDYDLHITTPAFNRLRQTRKGPDGRKKDEATADISHVKVPTRSGGDVYFPNQEIGLPMYVEKKKDGTYGRKFINIKGRPYYIGEPGTLERANALKAAYSQRF